MTNVNRNLKYFALLSPDKEWPTAKANLILLEQSVLKSVLKANSL